MKQLFFFFSGLVTEVIFAWVRQVKHGLAASIICRNKRDFRNLTRQKAQYEVIMCYSLLDKIPP